MALVNIIWDLGVAITIPVFHWQFIIRNEDTFHTSEFFDEVRMKLAFMFFGWIRVGGGGSEGDMKRVIDMFMKEVLMREKGVSASFEISSVLIAVYSVNGKISPS